ncbi:UDP-N-acetylmuramoylalanyl-D-glutamyl-2, 6-diaminopimelate--D-alanalanyl ligase [Salmonella enterica subsp. enterica serovar Daytona]|uniref:UDP-N-acetylmuramoylalanyl-D-glutamyl-2, 6-diaminopimelate--D-alanalanyl ligase n=1 Tax=Salmonella enterica subsp. enterica serovar Daytona TaxID=1962639 RepID=A0A447JNH3_SALET|nr:UDP-N-acetylmuramoylalanyl-D-glutamyl-2, 6-diaminopimelate--D-alanalanyl ligase [Salmonella enterica subsp. enterica serovar Daytona]
MISVTLSKIADVLGAEHRGADLTLDTVITDTRKVTPGCLFVALKGNALMRMILLIKQKRTALAPCWSVVLWISISRR